jgi:hypothetical protein
MMASTARILGSLEELGFDIHEGDMAPFDGPLPLVAGTAWHEQTAQLVLVAGSEGAEFDEDRWGELLFAAGGLRHHLSGGDRPAFGTPVVLALVDGEVKDRLRHVVEDLAANYALFDRVDLNLVSPAATKDPEELDAALAPLLPRCRAVGDDDAIGSEVLRRFWRDLRVEIHELAGREPKDAIFDRWRERVGADLANALIEDADRVSELEAPVPVKELNLSNFRSFEKETIVFGNVTILHGANGSGKTSVIEALELLWASDTQRRPSNDVDESTPAAYARHLRRAGDEDFAVSGTFESGDDVDAVTALADEPRAELARCVLTQDHVTSLVNSPPRRRMQALVEITGLEIPDLDLRTARIRDEARRRLDSALADCGMDLVATASTNGLEHLRDELKGGYVDWIPSVSDLVGAEAALAESSGGTYQAHGWSHHSGLSSLLVELDAKLEELSKRLEDRSGAVSALVEAQREVRALAAQARERARPLMALADRLMSALSTARLRNRPERVGPVPPGVAASWHAHAQGLSSAAEGFDDAMGSIDDEAWRARLEDYVKAIRGAAERAPLGELRRLAADVSTQPEHGRVDVPPALFVEAFFDRAPAKPGSMLAPLRELSQGLNRYASKLEELAGELAAHPAASFVERRERILEAVARYQVARAIRRRGPIDRASTNLLSDLLKTRLEPVWQELVRAMSRFEWYFKPLRVNPEGKELVIGGGATLHDDLDIRMLLNSAERTVVGLSWFLAMHLLQPPDRRRVLVLDDPAGALDSSNLAGFIATLRAFVRLVRPEQLIVATHSETTALTLEEELAPVGSWPVEVVRIRCRRDGDSSVAQAADPVVESADLGRRRHSSGLATRQMQLISRPVHVQPASGAFCAGVSGASM